MFCLQSCLKLHFTSFRPKTGFQLWLEENRKSILADNPDFEEMDVIKEGMGRFRTLSAEERLVRHVILIGAFGIFYPQLFTSYSSKVFRLLLNPGRLPRNFPVSVFLHMYWL